MIELIPMRVHDYNVVLEIYNCYVENSTVSFHYKTISETELREFLIVGHPKYRSYFIYSNSEIAGYCYSSI